MNRRFRFALAAAAAILTSSVAASAQQAIVRHVEVDFGDLDLSSRAGRTALEDRIDAAAVKACGGNPVFRPTYRDAPQFSKKAFEHCRAEARYQALSYLDRHGVRLASR